MHDLLQAQYRILSIIFWRIHKIECKHRHEDKKCETCKIKYCNYFIECTNVNDDLIEYKCLCFNKNYQHKFNDNL